MAWWDPTRVNDFGPFSSPVSEPSSRSPVSELRHLVSDSTSAISKRTLCTPSLLRTPRLMILHSIWTAIRLRTRIPQSRSRAREPNNHPGWNISDEIDLSPRGECRYLVELVRGQSASIAVASTHPVTIAVCDDDDFDSWEDGESCFASDCKVISRVCDGFSDDIGFCARRTGAYDLIFYNPGDQLTHLAICITAPPVRQTAKRTGAGDRSLTIQHFCDRRCSHNFRAATAKTVTATNNNQPDLSSQSAQDSSVPVASQDTYAEPAKRDPSGPKANLDIQSNRLLKF